MGGEPKVPGRPLGGTVYGKCVTHHACDCIHARLREAEEALKFYADPEKWMIKEKDGSWRKSSPKNHGDYELIRSYEHPTPNPSWPDRNLIGSVQVGGKRARKYFEKWGGPNGE